LVVNIFGRSGITQEFEDLNPGIYRSTAKPGGRFVRGNTALLDILRYKSMQRLGEVNVIDVLSKPNGKAGAQR
jgi:hypothetical protein